MNKKEHFESPACRELLAVAERELGAFISAVAELYDAEQASLAAMYWLDQLESMNSLPGSTSRDWRLVTVAAIARLANRPPVNPVAERRRDSESFDLVPQTDSQFCDLDHYGCSQLWFDRAEPRSRPRIKA